MEVTEEKLPEEQPVREKMIPVFTVLKNGAILKNIFILNTRHLSSPERTGADVEEILVVGRHPDCDILLTHPSISRFHFEIRSIPSRQKLFLTDLSSVHGTWVGDQRVEPDGCVEVKEGDVIRIGGSTRIYRLHWIPLSRAYAVDSPFVSPLDASTAMELEEEKKLLESENLEAALQSLADTASGDDRDLHLDVASEGTGSSVSSVDEDAPITTTEVSLPLASRSVLTPARDSAVEYHEDSQILTNWDLDVVESAADKPISSCSGSKRQQSSGKPEDFGCFELGFDAAADEFDARVDAKSERMELSVLYGDEDPYLAGKEASSLQTPTDTNVVETLDLTEDFQASPELAISILEVDAENLTSGCSTSKGQTSCCFQESGCSAFELAAEVGVPSPDRGVTSETKFSRMEVSAETRGIKSDEETEISRNVIAESPNSLSNAESTSEMLAKETQILAISESQSEMTESENLNKQSSIETKVGARQVSAVSDCLYAGKECLSRNNVEDSQSLCLSWQPLTKSEVQNQESGMTRETENIFDEGSVSEENGTQKSSLTPIQKSITELSNGESYSLSKIESEAYTDKGASLLSTFGAETFKDTKATEELTCESNGSQERQILQASPARDDVLSPMTCNIWSRRGKAASILQLRTNNSEKKTGSQPKGKLHRKQILSDNKSVSLTVHIAAEKLEPEIFTPDKENLTPTSHMLKRLQEFGDIKDTKSSSSSKIPSSTALVDLGAFTEPEIFTPDKENLTPNSHILKRLRQVADIKEKKGSSSKAIRKTFFDMHVMAEQKPDRHSTMNTDSKKKTERAPFHHLFEKSPSQSQTYNETCTVSARNNISRGIRSSSILSDSKSKMKWTIVLDSSSLMDKESRKPLILLQGLKRTHLVIPRTVIRELNETMSRQSFLFRRRREIASTALDWIEECKVNTKWWIQVQSSAEETKANAPTPPVTPHQSDGSSAFQEIDSPTAQDQVLECALHHRYRNNDDEKLVLLSKDPTLKIKAMAEGVICETAHEFYESLSNPLSERFMWKESLPRGRTWSKLDEVVVRERYNNNGASAAKGLKLILLHNSHYGHTQ